MIPTVGQKVGPYEILGRLGSGGMGLVFSAWDSRLQRDVAIKLLREEFSSREMRERFLQEARAASRLNHPNICTVFDIGEQDGDPYLVMELLKGETLRHRMFAGLLAADCILQIGIQVADALASAHARGVIHRDIKPANVFLIAQPNGGWKAKVLDFGLAKVDLGTGYDTTFHLTGAGATVGTVSYMSPEQARGEAIDARSDLFALGIMLYEMACGHVPFQGDTSALVFVQLLGHSPASLQEVNPAIPRNLERVIFKLLAKDLTSRYQSASDVVAALNLVSLRDSGVARQGIRVLSSWRRRRSAHASLRQLATSSASWPTLVKKTKIEDIVSAPLPFLGKAPSNSFPPAKRFRGIDERESDDAERFERAPTATTSDKDARAVTPRARSIFDRGAKAAVSGRPTVFSSPADLDKAMKDVLSCGQTKSFSGWCIATTVLLATSLIYGVAHWTASKRRFSTTGVQKLLVASVVNRTEDKSLDVIVQKDLSERLAVRGRFVVPDNSEVTANMRSAGIMGDAPANPSEAQVVARADRATRFLVGEIRHVEGAYVIDVRVYDTSTLGLLTAAEEKAPTRRAVSDAVERLAAAVRAGLGASS